MIGYDSAGTSFPNGGSVYLGYVSGAWVSYPAALAAAARNKARAVSVATSATVRADELDVEHGDATITQVPGWFPLSSSRRPTVYVAVSTVDLLVVTLRNAGIPRERYAIHSAHWDRVLGRHVCGPQTCGACSWPCDATQWQQTVGGPDTYDVSEILPSFFGGPVITTAAAANDSQRDYYETVTTPATENKVLSRRHWWQATSGTSAGMWRGPETLPS